MVIGDLHTRPDVETFFVPNSFNLRRVVREWESGAFIPWALHLPRNAGARDNEELLIDELQLQQGDVTITLH